MNGKAGNRPEYKPGKPATGVPRPGPPHSPGIPVAGVAKLFVGPRGRPATADRPWGGGKAPAAAAGGNRAYSGGGRGNSGGGG